MLAIKILKIVGKVLIGVILSVVLLLVVINVLPFTISSVKGDNQFRKKTDYPLVIPHGGAKLLYPENTIYAYDELLDLGVDVLEIDLALTAPDENGDGVLITHHDLYLDMAPGHMYDGELIRNIKYQDLIDAYGDVDNDYYLARTFKGVDPNNEYPFATENDPTIMERMIPSKISEVFAKAGNSVLYILEIKDVSKAQGFDPNIHDFELATQTLVDLIIEYELEDYVLIGSFDDDVISYIKEHYPQIKTGAATNEVTNFSIYSAAYIDFFWNIKSEVLILPNPESQRIPDDKIGLISGLPSFIRDNIAVLDENDVWRTYLIGKQIINDAHRKNMAVLYWTVNDEDEMRLLIERGADGIITDRPDILIALIEAMKNE